MQRLLAVLLVSALLCGCGDDGEPSGRPEKQAGDADGVTISVPPDAPTMPPRRPPFGERCDASHQCVTGYCVDGVCCEQPVCETGDSCAVLGFAGVCAPLYPPGPLPCTKDSQCLAGLVCRSGQCTFGQRLGDLCYANEHCASGHCVDQTCCEVAACPTGLACNNPRAAGRCDDPPPTPSPTPTPRQVALHIVDTHIDAATAAGEFSVSLDSPDQSIAGTQNDCSWDSAALSVLRKADGRPDCDVNPAIDKRATSFAFRPRDCTDCKNLRALVLSTENTAPIPDGAVLYTCRVALIAPATLSVESVIASSPQGTRISAIGESRVLTND